LEPEGSLPCSQKPTTDPYPDPDESSPHPPILFLQHLFYIIIPSTLISSYWALLCRFPCQNFVCTSLPCMLHNSTVSYLFKCKSHISTQLILFFVSMCHLWLLVHSGEKFKIFYINFVSWDSVVSIATGYGLDDRGVGVRVPVGSWTFSSPHHPDWLWGPPTSYPMGTRGFLPGGKAAGAWSWPLISI
jgi:hypothetical protein